MSQTAVIVQPSQFEESRPHRARTSAGERTTLGIWVRQQLLGQIRTGRWHPGDRLPTEPELMKQFGVSRTPVREAMQSLKLLGVLDISPRRGATVQALPVESALDMAVLSGLMRQERSIADVFEFRYANEVAIAELAARRATDEHLSTLRVILADNLAAVDARDGAAALAIDVRFHAAIASASGNQMFTTVMAALNAFFVEIRALTGGIPGASAAALVEHQRILDALIRRDARAARTATRDHIRRTESRYQAAGTRHGEAALADNVRSEQFIVKLDPQARPVGHQQLATIQNEWLP